MPAFFMPYTNANMPNRNSRSSIKNEPTYSMHHFLSVDAKLQSHQNLETAKLH